MTSPSEKQLPRIAQSSSEAKIDVNSLFNRQSIMDHKPSMESFVTYGQSSQDQLKLKEQNGMQYY